MFGTTFSAKVSSGCKLGDEVFCSRPGVRHLLLGLHGRGIGGWLSRAAARPKPAAQTDKAPMADANAIPPTGDADDRQEAAVSLGKLNSDSTSPRPEERAELVAELTSQLAELSRQNQELCGRNGIWRTIATVTSISMISHRWDTRLWTRTVTFRKSTSPGQSSSAWIATR